MKRPHYREGTRADRDAILALRRVVFPAEDVEKQQPDFWTWEFAGAARFFVAEVNDRIVGHMGFVPQLYDAGRTVRGAMALDAMTHPEYRRQNVFTGLASFAANQIRKDVQLVTAFQIRRPVLGGMVRAGWRASAAIAVLLRPLSMWQIARDVSGAAIFTANVELRTTSSPIRAMDADDLDPIDALLETTGIRQKRTAEFLRWRYLQNEYWRYEMHGFYEGKQLHAFLIHRETKLRGLRSLAIADAGVLPGSEPSLQQLVEFACGKSRKRGIGIAAALVSGSHPAYRALRACGFFAGPHRFRLLLQVFDASLDWAHDAQWSLSWGDTDHL